MDGRIEDFGSPRKEAADNLRQSIRQSGHSIDQPDESRERSFRIQDSAEISAAARRLVQGPRIEDNAFQGMAKKEMDAGRDLREDLQRTMSELRRARYTKSIEAQEEKRKERSSHSDREPSTYKLERPEKEDDRGSEDKRVQ